MNDLILVGGGLAGLAAATWSREPGSRHGARARGGPRRAGPDGLHRRYAFNLGGHALYVGGPASAFGNSASSSREAPRRVALVSGGRGRAASLSGGAPLDARDGPLRVRREIEAARALATLGEPTRAPLATCAGATWLATRAPRQEVRDAIALDRARTTYANAPERASAGATIAQIKRGASSRRALPRRRLADAGRRARALLRSPPACASSATRPSPRSSRGERGGSG